MNTEVNTEQDLNATLDRIMRDLDVGMNEFPEAALREAQRYRQEITPRLIAAIRTATARAAAGETPSGNAHLFATMLLTEFRAKEALPAILEAISLPGKWPDALFGESITDDLPTILAALGEDAPELIEAIVANRALNDYTRWSAADTFVYFVRDGRMTRDEAVERLRVLLRQAIADKDGVLARIVVIQLDSLGPREAELEIRRAFQLNLIEQSIISMRSIKESMAEGERRVRESLERCPPTGFSDAVEYMRNWYHEPERPSNLVEWDAGREAFLQSTLVERQLPSAGTIVHSEQHVGRNDPCPCGCGKKFKKCCGGR